jgi:uncharacterized metal-binding protein
MNQPQQDRQPLATMVFVACMILIVFSCVGCSTVVPVTQKFPEAPGQRGHDCLSTTAKIIGRCQVQ